MGSRKDDKHSEHDGACPGKIFIGGLAKDTTMTTFLKHFGKYGEIIDSVIMKDRYTQQPRGFGFITYSDPSVVDKVIEDNHVLNGKQVEIKRTIPKGSSQSKDFKTKKIFVGGIPSTVTSDEFKSFFSKYGKVVEHEIINDHITKRSRGFGFVVYDSENVVDELLSKGNMIDLAGSQVEIKKAEPKKTSSAPPPHFGSDYRDRPYGGEGGLGGGYGGGSFGGFGGGGGGFGPSSYRGGGGAGGLGPRIGGGGYGAGPDEFVGGGNGYGGYAGAGGGLGGGYRGAEPSLGYSSRFGSYGGGGFGGGYGAAGFGGGYGRDEGFGGYGGSGYGGGGAGYDSGPGAGGYGSAAGGGGLYGGARGGGGYGAGAGPAGRYHPYAR